MKNIISFILATVLIGTIALTQTSCTNQTRAQDNERVVVSAPNPDMTTTSDRNMNSATDPDITGWSEASKMAVMMMKDKYGEPTSVTSEMMMWENTGQWKRTVIYAKEYEHNFPLPHTDVMQQWIDYEVPAEKFSELAEYDGSVVVNRTNGEMSARCDLEGANFLAINIAHDVIEGNEDAQSARDLYAQTIKDMLNGDEPAYMQKLQFNVASGNTAFVDSRHSSITQNDIAEMNKMKEMMRREMLAKRND